MGLGTASNQQETRVCDEKKVVRKGVDDKKSGLQIREVRYRDFQPQEMKKLREEKRRHHVKVLEGL